MSKTTSFFEDIEKINPCALLVRKQTITTIQGKNTDVSQQNKNRATTWYKNSIIGYMPREMKPVCQKHMHFIVG